MNPLVESNFNYIIMSENKASENKALNAEIESSSTPAVNDRPKMAKRRSTFYTDNNFDESVTLVRNFNL